MKTKTILSLTSILSLTTSLQAMAGLTLTADQLKIGAAQTDNSVAEFAKGDACIIPAKYVLNENDQYYSDQDQKREKKLCKFDLNTTPLCPKLNSTNPGILIIDPKDVSPETTITNSMCKAKTFGVEAKFKQSITCSYAPSALAAYHLSRILGDQLITPVAVARSMNKQRHSELINQALDILAGRSNEIIYKSWNQFKARNAEGSESKLYLSSEKGTLLYGALSENLKHESIYTEVSGVGPYDTRYQRFTQQVPFKRVTNPESVKNIIGDEINELQSIPALQQMIDVSNMIVLDTLLAQDDRIGNIHFYLSYARLNGDGTYSMKPLKKDDLKRVELSMIKQYKSISRWKENDITRATDAYNKYKLDQIKNNDPKADKDFTADGILLRQMVLKDNDCGVDVDKRSNNMRGISAIESLSHISPTTYFNILRLQQAAKGTELKDFFTNTLLYRSKDYTGGRKTFLDNLTKVAETLKEHCNNGSLKVDLGIQKNSDGHFGYFQNKSCTL